MNATEFIIKKIDELLKQIPNIRVRYEHREIARVHFVEIVPNEVFHSNPDYIKWESNLFDEYVKRFPDENICFVSDDDFVGIDKADYDKNGILYAQFSEYKDAIQIIPEVIVEQSTNMFSEFNFFSDNESFRYSEKANIPKMNNVLQAA